MELIARSSAQTVCLWFLSLRKVTQMFHLKKLFSRREKPLSEADIGDWNDAFNWHFDVLKYEEHHEQSPFLVISDPIEQNILKRFRKGYKVKIKRGTSRIKLFRYLLTKSFLEPDEGLHLDEYVVLMELWVELMENKDPIFIEKYGNDFLKSLNLYNQFREVQSFPIRIEPSQNPYPYILRAMKNLIMEGNAYFGMKGNRDIRRSYVLQFMDAKQPVRFPSESFIGVGYKDKGTCRVVSYDGSQSWQEIASSENLYSGTDSVTSSKGEKDYSYRNSESSFDKRKGST